MGLRRALVGALLNARFAGLAPIQRRVLRGEAAAAAGGSADSVGLLIDVLRAAEALEVREQAITALANMEPGPAFDALAFEWAQGRDPILWELIGSSRARPSQTSLAYLLTELKRGRRWTYAGTEGTATHLLRAHQDIDPEIAARAPAALAQSTAPSVVPELIRALDDRDEAIRRLAASSLAARTKVDERRVIAAAWADTRDARLLPIVQANAAVPTEPPYSRVIVALLLAQPREIAALGRQAIDLLVRAVNDRDKSLGSKANEALLSLEDRDAQDEICRLALTGSKSATEIAIAAKYLPRDEYAAALFLFTTNQIDRYDALDPDHSLLATYLQSATPETKQAVATQARQLGRTDLLPVIVGDYRSKPESLSADDARYLIKSLAASEAWGQLWRLAFELAPALSLEAVKVLRSARWEPSSAADLETFEAFDRLLNKADPTFRLAIGSDLPPALRRAEVGVRGSVNAMAFSPSDPAVALGSSQRHVVIWDFQRARLRAIEGEIEHSIAHVAFTRRGDVVVGERTNSDANCGVWVHRPGSKRWSKVLAGSGSITGLEAAGDRSVFISDRGGNVYLHELGAESQTRRARIANWAREVRVAPDGRTAIAMNHGAIVFSLPDLTVVSRIANWGWGGVIKNAAFTSDSAAIAFGKFNGEVAIARARRDRLVADSSPLYQHRSKVQGVEVVAGRGALVSASADGDIRFFAVADKTRLGNISVGSGLRSLNVSPDGAFMAVGHTDEKMSFWDLRPLELPALMAEPLVRAKPNHLAAVSAAIDSLASGNTATRLSLTYLQVALRHMFRYAVRIEDVRTIKRGQYDITLN